MTTPEPPIEVVIAEEDLPVVEVVRPEHIQIVSVEALDAKETGSVFEELVGVLSGEVVGNQEFAIQSLLNLSADASNASALVAARVIPHLVSLLRSDVLLIKILAAGVLGNLSVSVANDVQVVAKDVIIPLVAIVCEGRDARGHALRALANFARYQQNLGLIVGAGAIPPTVDSLLLASRPEVQCHAACTLRNLTCFDGETKLSIARAGALPRLINLAAEQSNSPAGQHAEMALRGLGQHDQVRVMLKVERAKLDGTFYSTLVSGLSSGGVKLEATARTLAQLAAVQSDHARLLTAGILAPTVALLRGDVDRAVRLQALLILARLTAKTEECRSAAAGAIVPLIAIIRGPLDTAICQNALSILTGLSRDNLENKLRMLAAGIIDAVLSVIVRSRGVVLQTNAICVLRNLSSLDDARKLIVAAGGIPLLVAFAAAAVTDSSDKNMVLRKEHASIAVRRLALDEDVKPLIAVETARFALKKSKASLAAAVTETAKAQNALEVALTAATEARAARLLRESASTSLEAKNYEQEAIIASLRRQLGDEANLRADATPQALDVHRDKRAKTALDDFDDATTCVVCRDRPRSLVLLPCAHACLCSACATSIQATSKSCPICRATIAKTTAFRLA